jgi:hypothetical protein
VLADGKTDKRTEKFGEVMNHFSQNVQTHLKTAQRMRNAEGKRVLGTYRGRWEDIIKMNLKGMRLERLDEINLTQNRENWGAVVNTVMKRRAA